MPIQGKILAMLPLNCVKKMQVGEEGFVYCDDIIITLKNVAIDFFAPVYKTKPIPNEDEEEDYEYDIGCFFVRIERIAEGLDEDSFILDFSEVEEIIQLTTVVEYQKIMLAKDIDTFLVFKNDITELAEDLISEKVSVESNHGENEEDLQAELDEALRKEEFIRAAEIRDKINKKKAQLKKKQRK